MPHVAVWRCARGRKPAYAWVQAPPGWVAAAFTNGVPRPSRTPMPSNVHWRANVASITHTPTQPHTITTHPPAQSPAAPPPRWQRPAAPRWSTAARTHARGGGRMVRPPGCWQATTCAAQQPAHAGPPMQLAHAAAHPAAHSPPTRAWLRPWWPWRVWLAVPCRWRWHLPCWPPRCHLLPARLLPYHWMWLVVVVVVVVCCLVLLSWLLLPWCLHGWRLWL
jgi:hypothetical protein